ncbi:MAG: hypothetical protein IPG74_15535 [Flavobacteriales bacterium]|nr:hypothetical protein [Flavobacteriales bacterium]
MMGQVSSGAVLLLAAGAFTMYMFNPSFDWVLRLFEKKEVVNAGEEGEGSRSKGGGCCTGDGSGEERTP